MNSMRIFSGKIKLIGKWLQNFNKQQLFRNWLSSNQLNGLIESIEIANATYTGNSRKLKMAFLICTMISERGNRVRNVLLRGKAVAILVVLIDQTTKEKHGVFVKQERLAVGKSDFAEIIAGMIEDSEEPEIAAAREVLEEAEILIETDRLSLMSIVCLSPGITDETIYLYSVEVEMSTDQIYALRGIYAGLAEEGERTEVCIVPLSNMIDYIGWDAKSALAYMYYLNTYNG